MKPVTVLELRQPRGGKLDLWSLARRIEQRVVELEGPKATSRRPPVTSIEPPESYPIRWLGDQELYVRVAFHDVCLPLPADQVPLAVIIVPDAEAPTPLASEAPAEPAPSVEAAPVRRSIAAEREQLIDELRTLLGEQGA